MNTKNTILILAAIAIVAAGGYWLYNSRQAAAPATNETDTQAEIDTAESVAKMEPGTYAADTDESAIAWEAGKPAISGYVHHGTFSLDSGSVTLDENSLSGDFVIDINSLHIVSLGGGKAGQESALEGHLKSSAFFDTEKYPTASFRITDASPKVQPGPSQTDYTAKGELTMKGQTHEIEFPMKVIVNEDGSVNVTASLDLDRTEWGINFGSAKVVEQITNQVIGDTVGIDLDMKFQKQ